MKSRPHCSFVVCIDDDWVGADGQECVGPQLDSVQVLTSSHSAPDGSVWHAVAGWFGFWEATAFRPITASEYDSLVDGVCTTGSGASKWSEVEYQV